MSDPILMTGAEGRFVKTDIPEGLMPMTANSYGIVAVDPTLLAALDFEGVATEHLLDGPVKQRLVMALPDLVLLRATCEELVKRAVENGLLLIPDDFVPQVEP